MMDRAWKELYLGPRNRIPKMQRTEGIAGLDFTSNRFLTGKVDMHGKRKGPSIYVSK